MLLVLIVVAFVAGLASMVLETRSKKLHEEKLMMVRIHQLQQNQLLAEQGIHQPLHMPVNSEEEKGTRKVWIIGFILFFCALALIVYKHFSVDIQFIRMLGWSDYLRMKSF